MAFVEDRWKHYGNVEPPEMARGKRSLHETVSASPAKSRWTLASPCVGESPAGRGRTDNRTAVIYLGKPPRRVVRLDQHACSKIHQSLDLGNCVPVRAQWDRDVFRSDEYRLRFCASSAWPRLSTCQDVKAFQTQASNRRRLHPTVKFAWPSDVAMKRLLAVHRIKSARTRSTRVIARIATPVSMGRLPRSTSPRRSLGPKGQQ